MQRILLSLLTVGLAASLAVGATRAYFSDTETSTGNTFTAGTLDLKVDDKDDPNVVHVSLTGMKPGSTASYSWTLKNAGSLAGKPWIEITNLKNYDNDCNDAEIAAPDDTCGNPGLGDGELGQYLMMKLNAPGSVGYVYPNDPSCVGGNQCSVNYWSGRGHIDGIIDGQTWDTIAPASSLAPMVLEFQIPTTVGNIIQSDSLEFDVVFHLEQV
jgi:spore coat-associated protein N